MNVKPQPPQREQPAGHPGGESPVAAPQPASTITLRFGDEPSPETWTVDPDLVRTIGYAARLRMPQSVESQFPVSFATLLSATFYADTPWSRWALEVAVAVGPFSTSMQGAPAGSTPPTGPLRTTGSAARLLRSARGYAEQSGVAPGVQHLLAAYIFEPAGHERDLERIGFQRLAMANALVEEVRRRAPADAAVITGLRDRTYPVTESPVEQPAETDAETQTETPAEAPAEAGETPGPEPASPALADEVLQALAWALALRNSTTLADVGMRELFAALLRVMPADSDIWPILRHSAPELVGDPDAAPWMAAWRILGCPDLTTDPAPLSDVSGLPPEVDALLARARDLQRRVGDPGADVVQGGGVFLAMFVPPSAGAPAPVDPLLPLLGLDADALLREIQNQEDVRTDVAAHAVFQEIRKARGAFRPWSRPHVDNDLVNGPISPDHDLLDARRPALRFARLLAAKEIHPPIALGLFGNWGSGKTFFMGLMRDRIGDLAANGGPDYVRRVVQIEFNAWHYHDTNLWASLAIRIFEGLARELAGNKETDIEATRRALHQRLRSSEARRTEAEARRNQAQTKRANLSRDLEEKRARRQTLEQRSMARQLELAWDAVRTQTVFAELRTEANGLATQFGITTALVSVADLRRLRADIEETSGRAFGLTRAVGHRFGDVTTGVKTTGLLLLAGAAALTVGAVAETVAAALGTALPQLSSTVIEVSTLVSTAAAWSSRRVAQLRAAVDHIGSVEAALAAARPAEEPDDLKKLRTQIEAVDKEIHQAGEELSASEREIADATAEIDRINRGGLVYDFLQERQTSASYTGQLGLISTIRQDLDRLGALLRDFRTEGTHPIERIVLYIDDLDRCHPDKVVEVLQAVHLLLAFDLFNVVVGVDARWLERSLRRRYVGRAGRKAAVDSFSPQDYLEKIFQIPYALGRIDETGFKQLVDGLIETRSDQAKKQRAQDAKARAEAAARAAAEATAAANAVAEPAGDDVTAAKGAGAMTGAHSDGVISGGGHSAAATSDSKETAAADAAATAGGGGAGSGSGGTSGEAMAPALYFEDHEETFIKGLYDFIDRPRLAKRFINIYRLLRVRADDEDEHATFAASDTSPEYRAALLLLAIQVGHPAAAAAITTALATPGAGKTWNEVLVMLTDATRPDALAPEVRNDVGAVARKLARLGEVVPQESDAYVRWAPRVACYSFDWHGVGAERSTSSRPTGTPATPPA